MPAAYVKEVSEGRVDYAWPAQVNRLLKEGGHDLILSIGQVVPHEVIGMANYNKNIFVGTGGPEGINKSHFLGAAYGMERIMGRAQGPVRQVLNYASEHFATDLPLVYIQTVIGRNDKGELVTRGIYIGDDEACFLRAAELSLAVNFEMLDRPLHKVVVYLEPEEFRSTWLGNKSIYRTRMAMADEGELIVLAPGLKEFGEDPEIDCLIRKYGYRGTPATLDADQKMRYSRHLLIPEVGEQGQMRLLDSRVLMIGAGGLGYKILYSIQRIDLGVGVEAGLGILIIAIVLDRILQGLTRRQKKALIRE